MLVLHFAEHHSLPTWLMVLATLLPALMVALVVFFEWRYVRAIDELERRVQLEAMFIAGGVTGVVTFTAGMLRSFGVVEFKGGLIMVLPLMSLVYGIAGWCCRRKYGLKGMC